MADPQTFSATSVIFSQYELLRRIFTYLPVKDLKSCAQVSQTFANVASRTLADPERSQRPLVRSWRGQPHLPSYYESHELFRSPEHEDMYQEWRKWLNETRSEPRTCVTFHTGDFFQVEDRGLSFGEAFRANFFVDSACLDRMVPRACSSISLMSPGIVVMDPLSHKPLEIENARGVIPAISMVAFPRRPNCQIIPFNIPEDLQQAKESLLGAEAKVSDAQLRQKALRQLTEGHIEDLSTIKGVILLSDALNLSHTTGILQEIWHHTHGDFALGGVLGHFARCSSVPETQSLEGMYDTRSWDLSSGGDVNFRTSGLILAGSGIQVASQVIPQSIRSEKKVLAALNADLKTARNINEDNAVAFMFACCGRGAQLYKGKKNVESRAFQHVFPKIPVVGVFGNGEIGLDFHPGDQARVEGDGKRERKSFPSSEQYTHSYCTVFVVVSFERS